MNGAAPATAPAVLSSTDKGQSSEKQQHVQNAILLSLNGVFTNF
jgi:hypothetical protein